MQLRSLATVSNPEYILGATALHELWQTASCSDFERQRFEFWNFKCIGTRDRARL